MIDLHTHLLPGVDDGARDLDEALALCRRAVEDGTTTAVVTPHSGAHLGLPGGDRPARSEVEAWTATLQATLDELDIALHLVPGAELYYDQEALGRPDQLITLGGSRAVLLELPADGFPPGVPQAVFRLQAAGLRPVIAHPERNLGILRRPELLYDLVSRGCLAQVTAMCLTGAMGQVVAAAAAELVEHGLVQVISSDAHWWPHRPTGLSAAVARAATLVGPEVARVMVEDVPRAVLEDVELTPAIEPAVPRRRPGWRLF